MATKKYLSLDEAAQELGIANDQVVRLREQGKLRGFADRGTWKFKADDVEEYNRTRQADSDPDVPIISDEDDSVLAGPGGERLSSSSVLGTSSILAGEGSDQDEGDQPTVIRKDSGGSAILDEEPLLASSDSDVRLYRDSGISAADSNPDVAVQKESDSDVRLVDKDQGEPSGKKSDSDVQLADDKNAGEEDTDTVSDVRLLSDDDTPSSGPSGSDSDVALVSPGSGKGGSVFEDDDSPALADDSGIALESIADSGIALDSGKGGGQSHTPDSGIALAEDDPNKGSSIVSLGEDSGIALEALNEGAGGKSDATEYNMDSADDSEFELAAGNESASGDDTSVIMFDDDDNFEVSAASGVDQDSSSHFSDGDVVELDEDDEFAEAEAGSSVVMGEFDDDDMEFEAADEDFDDGFQTGESAADFSTSPGRVVAAPEPEIGGLAFTGLALSSVLLAVCGLMMFDLVRSMWGYHDPTVSSWLLESTKGLF